MPFSRHLKFGEPQLIIGFTLLIFLMIAIGLAGIWKIESLSKIVDVLGKRSLVIEKSVLEMKISNTSYALGVRNFVLWQTSKYLGAVSSVVDLEEINNHIENFMHQLKTCASYSYKPEQKEWFIRLSNSAKELRNLGTQVITLVKQGANAQEVNSLLLVFENSFYKINEYLDQTIAMANFRDIDQQIESGYIKKKEAITLLTWVLFLGLAIGAVTSTWIYARRKQERSRKEEMVRQVITLEERERQNLSAQIHDQMAQDLSALKIYTGVIEQAMGQKEESAEFNHKIAQMKRILSGLIEKTHNICLLLRPPALDELGLVDSIEALILEFKQLSGIDYVYDKPEGELRLSPEVSLFLYRLAQEALTNMAKYAQAKHVALRLSQDEKGIEFLYEDDGLGFDYDKTLNQPCRRSEDKLKLGLLGLQERAELLGGEMCIDSATGKGVRIALTLPLRG